MVASIEGVAKGRIRIISAAKEESMSLELWSVFKAGVIVNSVTSEAVTACFTMVKVRPVLA